jgi:putative redox protein
MTNIDNDDRSNIIFSTEDMGDVMALREIIQETQAALRSDPKAAAAVFSADSRQVEGVRSEARIRQFTVTIDEPPSLGGTDAGPNPVELVLAALAACQEITYRAYATALGVPLDTVSVSLQGDLDLRGFFAVGNDVRPGFAGVRGTVTLKSSAPAAELDKLKAIVDAHCPVLDMLKNPVPVELALNVAPVAAAAE